MATLPHPATGDSIRLLPPGLPDHLKVIVGVVNEAYHAAQRVSNRQEMSSSLAVVNINGR